MTWQEHLKRCSAQYQAEKKANAKGRAAAIKKPVRRVTNKTSLQTPLVRKNYKFRPGVDVDRRVQKMGKLLWVGLKRLE